jgi:hypothetical protein
VRMTGRRCGILMGRLRCARCGRGMRLYTSTIIYEQKTWRTPAMAHGVRLPNYAEVDFIVARDRALVEEQNDSCNAVWAPATTLP